VAVVEAAQDFRKIILLQDLLLVKAVGEAQAVLVLLL
jgi:hypothetical protein